MVETGKTRYEGGHRQPLVLMDLFRSLDGGWLATTQSAANGAFDWQNPTSFSRVAGVYGTFSFNEGNRRLAWIFIATESVTRREIADSLLPSAHSPAPKAADAGRLSSCPKDGSF
ncbi:hypothetical protein EMIT051CA3_20784 [Pseudomonas chlororaphis]